MIPNFSWQELLWWVPSHMGNGWWVIVSLVAIPAAFLNFLYLIMNQKGNAVLVARCIIFAGIVMFALTPLNSGWAPWGALVFVTGTLLTGFLLATNWCERQTPWMDGVRMVRGWLQAAVTFLAGQRRAHGPGDTVALTRDGHD